MVKRVMAPVKRLENLKNTSLFKEISAPVKVVKLIGSKGKWIRSKVKISRSIVKLISSVDGLSRLNVNLIRSTVNLFKSLQPVRTKPRKKLGEITCDDVSTVDDNVMETTMSAVEDTCAVVSTVDD